MNRIIFFSQNIPFEVEQLNIRVKDDPTPLNYVQLYLTDAFFTQIVDEINCYTKQYLAANPDKSSNIYIGFWEPVSILETMEL